MSDIIQLFKDRGQGHVFTFFDDLSADEQAGLIAEAEQIDLDEIETLVRELIQTRSAGNDAIADELEPADFIPLPENGDPQLWKEAVKKGESALRTGRVAAFTVAGGQGTRLGYDGPKGTFGVTPVLKASLFQVFAEKILASTRLYGRPIPWYIMTSTINHEATVEFFETNEYFGLSPEKVHFFSQGLMPAVDADGKILLAGKANIALSPDGHGGALRALVRSGAIREMEADGIDVLSYFQVDNPLVRCIDPAFIGFHIMTNSDLSSKMVPKAYAEEKVGVFCQKDGEALVVEYSDLPDKLATEQDENGELRFRAGSIAIHIFSRAFVHRLGRGKDDTAKLPFHLAHKKVPFIDLNGDLQEPTEPNAYKFEMFVFDALPFAANPTIIETARADDFSPVKNAEGVDSAQTCRDDQLRQFARWAAAAGIDIETDETGLPPFAFEVSPLFADNGERFVERWNGLAAKPELTNGVVLI
ncbi:UDPGP type 1 family protein [Verrucomicrobiales bacterium BCK34]|nr:UDPGP type 1 family protein [Verrucomicrobiales bacterium BCK34]